jgi:DNA processing protein
MSRTALRRRVAACLALGAGFDGACEVVFSAGAVPPNAAWIAAQCEHVAKDAIELIARGDAGFPVWLASIPDPPFAVFVRGVLDGLAEMGVAIVGSRRCTPGGENLARRLARDVAGAGLPVVSGLALGIDGAAHRGALDANGVTLAVLGAGHAHVYPRRHGQLAAEIVERGAILTEHPPTVLPQPHHFPERNRLISGLARAVVVVEAGEKSGSLTTARMALEQGREVMAVPGSPLSGRSRGCHRLIQAGAALVEDAADVLAALGLAAPTTSDARPSIDAWSARVLAAVTAEDAIDFDALVDRLRLPVERVLETLARLEVDGFVERVDGGYIRRPR